MKKTPETIRDARKKSPCQEQGLHISIETQENSDKTSLQSELVMKRNNSNTNK